MGSLRVGHNWATSLSLFTFLHWRRKWQPTPVFLLENPRDGGAWWLLSMGSHRVGHNWSDLAAAAACNLDSSLCFMAFHMVYSACKLNKPWRIPFTVWKTPQWEAHAPQLESSLWSPQLEKVHAQQKRPRSINKYKLLKKKEMLENYGFILKTNTKEFLSFTDTYKCLGFASKNIQEWADVEMKSDWPCVDNCWSWVMDAYTGVHYHIFFIWRCIWNFL